MTIKSTIKRKINKFFVSDKNNFIIYKKLAGNKNKLELYFKNLGSLITSFRKEKGFSLEELGLQIGLDRSAMHRTENGKPMTVTTIIKLCLALDKEPKDFFTIDFDFKSNELGGLVKSKKSPKKKAASKK